MSKLVAFSERTGQPVDVGDTVTNFRGETGKLHTLVLARSPGRSGKVGVEIDGGTVWHYDAVWGLVIMDETDGEPVHPCGCPLRVVYDEGHQDGCLARDAQ